ncbi:pleckstrin homology domain-containing family D member 1-like isoform X2 [Amphiura filiformis]|uniref:pleckstrin homology domain-containing family D member 1-like isoform X2 n=1 Tax=Amphiura filiformis TaxID=82378 RepID=UPI003B220F09
MTDILYDDLLPSKVQLWGVLWKKPFGHNPYSSRWTKRFFIIKEGFLLYYAENEKRDFERKRFFNMHPKGVVPLGGALVEPINDPVKACAFRIDHEDLNGSIYLAVDSENERDRWIDMMKKSGRVTWKNAELGETMIQTLEKQSLELARDSQRYREQWHLEAMALRDEMDRTEELERITLELEEEKRKIEETARDLLEEHEKTKFELEETINAMKQVAVDKVELTRASQDFQSDLDTLARERKKTLSELNKREMQREDTVEKLTYENENLSEETTHLRDNLKHIEDKTKQLEREFRNVQERLRDKEEEAEMLEEEKRTYSQQARELESSLHDLTIQKEMTESELKEEIIARREAERRLRNAEESLKRLESALHESHPTAHTETPTEMDKEIFQNVASLKRFFEHIAAEAQIDADKPIIMKNALHARKSLVRKTKSFKYRPNRDKNTARHSFTSFRYPTSGDIYQNPRTRPVSSFSLAETDSQRQTKLEQLFCELGQKSSSSELDEVCPIFNFKVVPPSIGGNQNSNRMTKSTSFGSSSSADSDRNYNSSSGDDRSPRSSISGGDITPRSSVSSQNTP